jgi:hypothetical protein
MNPILRRTLWVAFWLALLVVVLVSAAAAAFLVWGLPELFGTITVNEQVILAPGSADAGHWLLATAGVLAAALALLLVVPVVLVLSLAAAAIALVASLSPLLLVGALAVWLWRRSARKPVQPGANIDAPSRMP